MSSVCAEPHHHKFHSSHQLFLGKKSLRDIEIPPRKLLSRRASMSPADAMDLLSVDSPRSHEETLLQKFLFYNNPGADSDDDDPYSSDHFRMYEFKIRRCTRSRSHDWTDCPFAHPGEKARRRDPRRYHYSGTVCTEFRRGSCIRGENCEFAHGVFECWLHPARYRTEACKDGKNCKRKVCFFAHTPRQLRVLPAQDGPPPPESPRKYRNCCAYCHSAIVASPTSPLIDMGSISPPMSPSPPLSPANSSFSPISRLRNLESCGLTQFGNGALSYKDTLTDLVASLEAMNVSSPNSGVNYNNNTSWVDVEFPAYDDDQQQYHHHHHHQRFVLSPPSPSQTRSGQYFKGHGYDYGGSGKKVYQDENSSVGGPDLGWVNDLLT